MPEITHTSATQIAPGVRRITARNPGKMTGPGTNTYVVGESEVAIIDPGPLLDEHIDSIERIFGDKIKKILVTHTHRDHSPAACALAERTGAQLIGNVIVNDGYQDTSFKGATPLQQDDVIEIDNFRIRALLTPGHVSNHVCYLVEHAGMLLTGDHMMQGSTVVIVPPAGNMKHYIESLERMLQYDVEVVAPGHGDLIESPREEIEHLIQHRLGREKKVVDALTHLGVASISALTPVVYDDVDPALHQWAALSLEAHLLKLRDEGRATEAASEWRLAAG